MAAGDNQQNPIGRYRDYHFAPGALYVHTSVGFIPAGYVGATGTGTPLGKTGAFEIKMPVTYAEQTSIQTGTELDDAAISGQKVEFGTIVKECSTDILEMIMDGIAVQRDSNDNPIRHGLVDKVGQRKRANAFRMTYVEINDGIEMWSDPGLVWDFPVTIVMNPDAGFTVDAETFREIPVMFRALLDRNSPFLGAAQFFTSRLMSPAGP